MKFLTKTIAAITIALFGFTSVLTANNLNATAADTTAMSQQDKEVLFERLERGLIFGLSSEVNGVIDSALFNAVNFKVEYPEFNPQHVKELINDLALNADTHTLRFKAYLTLAYYKNQDQFTPASDLAGFIDNNDQNKIFYHLQNEIRKDEITVAN